MMKRSITLLIVGHQPITFEVSLFDSAPTQSAPLLAQQKCIELFNTVPLNTTFYVSDIFPTQLLN